MNKNIFICLGKHFKICMWFCLNNSLVLGTNKIEITAAVIVLMKENVENFDLLNFLVLDDKN